MIKARKFSKCIALSGTSIFAASLLAATPALAQASAPAAPDADQALPAGTPAAQSDGDQAVTDAQSNDPDIVVTGLSIRGVPPTGGNLISVSRADIRTIGANTFMFGPPTKPRP